MGGYLKVLKIYVNSGQHKLYCSNKYPNSGSLTNQKVSHSHAKFVEIMGNSPGSMTSM